MQQPITSASIADRAYLAGLFDGEGMVGIYPAHRQGYPNYTTYVSIGMCDLQGLRLAHALYSGSLLPRRIKPPWRQMWYWKCSTAQAERFLVDVLPYLRIKREQAEIFLQFRATISQGTETPADVLDLRARLMQRCKELKRA